jgi:hypothetical protein
MSDWDHRQLCPDGACLGVINTDGACTVCGRVVPGWGDERQRGLRGPAEVEVATQEVAAAAAAVVDSDDPDWDQRRLCPDGACTGLVGADGRCGRCGARA